MLTLLLHAPFCCTLPPHPQLDDMEAALAFQASATDLRLARLAGLKAVTANFNQVLDVDDVGEPLESASK